MKKPLLSLLILLLAPSAFGFIPPLPSLMKEVLGDRKAQVGVEATLKHRVIVAPNQIVDIEERIVRDSSGVYFLWRIPGNAPIAAMHEKQGYALSKERVYPSRSTIFWKYLVDSSEDAVRDSLLTERFVRRDQFYQYKQGFNPTGDPSTWNLKENYVRHDDIYREKLPSGVAIAVKGYEEGNTARIVYFEDRLRDNRSRGLSRLEWRDADVVAAWSFSGFGKSIWENSYLPKHAQLDVNNSNVITTEIVSVRALKDRALFDAKSAWKAAAKSINVNSNVEPALKILVSYR